MISILVGCVVGVGFSIWRVFDVWVYDFEEMGVCYFSVF